jgi:hypothetical protein
MVYIVHIRVLRNAMAWLCGDREGCEIAQQMKDIPCPLVRTQHNNDGTATDNITMSTDFDCK